MKSYKWMQMIYQIKQSENELHNMIHFYINYFVEVRNEKNVFSNIL